VRAFIQLHQHFFRNQPLSHIISIVGAAYISKDNIEKNSYCTGCPRVTILSKDDIDSEESLMKWWKKMKSDFQEAFKHFTFSTEDYSSSSDSDDSTSCDTKKKTSDININCIEGYAGLLVIAEAVTDDKFLTLNDEEDDIIKNMILNEDQRKALLNPDKAAYSCEPQRSVI